MASGARQSVDIFFPVTMRLKEWNASGTFSGGRDERGVRSSCPALWTWASVRTDLIVAGG